MAHLLIKLQTPTINNAFCMPIKLGLVHSFIAQSRSFLKRREGPFSHLRNPKARLCQSCDFRTAVFFSTGAAFTVEKGVEEKGRETLSRSSWPRLPIKAEAARLAIRVITWPSSFPIRKRHARIAPFYIFRKHWRKTRAGGVISHRQQSADDGVLRIRRAGAGRMMIVEL